MLRDVVFEEIKEPLFDRPDEAAMGALPISEGTRVRLKYHGKLLSARVTAIERLGTSFVGCIRGFAAQDAVGEDLLAGDHIRFRLGDVCQID
jgi:hypothetical protein